MSGGNMKIISKVFQLKYRWQWNRKLRQRRIEVNRKGVDHITEISRELQKAGAEFFLDFGTLLGITREGKIISWDDDIDMGIYITDKFSWDDLEKAMNSLGYKKNHQFILEGRVTEHNYSKGDIYVDLFLHEEKDGHSFSYVYDRRDGKEYPSPKYWSVMVHKTPSITGTVPVEKDGAYYNIPVNAEEYLAAVYGENWKTPISGWTHYESPAVTVPEGLYSVMETFEE